MSETVETKSIVVERTLPHPIAKVWKALTTSELIGQWLMQNDFEPRVGHRFNFRATPIPGAWNGISDCEVLEVEAPGKLAWRQQASGDQKADGLDTVVTWTLTPVEGGTLVRMVQTGFRPQDEMGRQMMSGGWPRIVEGLGRVAGEL
ncbi:MAG TPA: SRPBCC domain-containing protein [Phenylobacterium sp.]|uniref:SRPBCC family protein n=1 Tax=Phenylobacterium sp. TaxID=1871053 RepID=UPI002BA86949|nr:SRPBCC domain-containing protein [Phenylobacterium sp.]HSV04168.1 SRPBCC domain-containing protein [Phenylobacterium sp.]